MFLPLPEEWIVAVLQTMVCLVATAGSMVGYLFMAR